MTSRGHTAAHPAMESYFWANSTLDKGNLFSHRSRGTGRSKLYSGGVPESPLRALFVPESPLPHHAGADPDLEELVCSRAAAPVPDVESV